MGVTTIEAALDPPGVQVNTPTAAGATAVKVVLLPGHTRVGFGVMVILGPGLTERTMVAIVVQLPEEPKAVYVVVTVGLNTTTPEVDPPGCHTTLAPVATKVTGLPLQLYVGENAVITTVGEGVKPMAIVEVLTQPAVEVPATV